MENTYLINSKLYVKPKPASFIFRILLNIFLEVLFRVRLIKIDSPRWFMELPVVKEYYEKRPQNTNIKIEKDGMFTYQLSENGLLLIDELLKNNLINLEKIEVLREEGLILDKEYEEFLINVKILRKIERNI